jgi:hypothetical protein
LEKIIGETLHLEYKMLNKDGAPVAISQDVKVSGITKGSPAQNPLTMNFKTLQNPLSPIILSVSLTSSCQQSMIATMSNLS